MINEKLFTTFIPTFHSYCWIRLITGQTIRAQKLEWTGSVITVKGADGNIYECDRNVRDGADVMVVLA